MVHLKGIITQWLACLLYFHQSHSSNLTDHFHGVQKNQ